MELSSFHGAFNARWIDPEDVARKFVPIPQFQRLTHTTHSILLGPRGSGKTTLLKMLTSRALSVWRSEREEGYSFAPFQYPNFESIYIPSDIRWSYEIQSLKNDDLLDQEISELVQRAMVTASVLISILDTFQLIIRNIGTDETYLCTEIIRSWELKGSLPIFRDIKNHIRKITISIRSVLNFRNKDKIHQLLETLPSIFFSHAIDAPVNSCQLFSDIYSDKLKSNHWALCYDELEIAPAWMRNEVLESIRSIDQKFLLKLTCSPLLPSGLKSAPEPKDDFIPVRLWNSHIVDARKFCEDLASNFLKIHFPEYDLSPNDFLSYSAFAQESEEECVDIYDRGSSIYDTMKNLAKVDKSFHELLVNHDIDPDDPYSEMTCVRDSILRKIKPIVLLRNAFLKVDTKRRSRKIVIVYAGKQSVYAMSEGNPRWLLGLLTDLHDRWQANPYLENNKPKISYGIQARALNSAARRYEAFLSSFTSGDKSYSHKRPESMYDFLKKIGDAIKEQLLGFNFPLDPFGSFYVDSDTESSVLETIEKALELGALVFVGKSDDDVPKNIVGSRFRITFMLSPIFRLPFRNYRDVSLKNLLMKGVRNKEGQQMYLF